MSFIKGMGLYPWYDTRSGIQERVDEGLAGLHALRDARHKAGYDKKERLQEWCIHGRFFLDTCGNWMKMETPLLYLETVADRDEMFKSQEVSISSSMGRCLPPVGDVCDRCLRGWDARTIGDYHWVENRPDEPIHRHMSCHRMTVIEEGQTRMRKLFKESGIPLTGGQWMIPNRYWGDSYWASPWMMFVTPAGPIRVGWRKRVLEIDWSASNIGVKAEKLTDDKVTKGDRMIHAWGQEKAVEYLQALWAHWQGSNKLWAKAVNALRPE